MHPKVYEAAKSGDFHSLMTTISENGEDLFHQTTPKGNNILHVAAQYQRVDFIRDILQHPSRLSLLEQGNNKGDTPLHVATERGSHKMVRVFTDWAKALQQPDAYKELLRKPNSYEDTLLHSAVRGGCKGVVELLIEEDPQLCDITNAADESPLYLAAHRRCSDIIEPILRASSSSPSSHKGPRGLTALHAAVHYPLPGWWRILEKRPELIREGDEMGWTPLHYVTFAGKVEVVRQLLQHDTSVAYDLDKEGQSALHIAASRGYLNIIDEIVKSCPDAWDIMNIKGQTALHATVIDGRVNVIKYILGMPNLEDLINERDTDGNTALHLAALHKQYNIIYILARDKRVDRLATNKDHLTALDIFSAHKEVGYRAAKVCHVLEISGGSPGFPGSVVQFVKKRLDKQHVEVQRAVSITTENNTANKENYDSLKISNVNLDQLVAVLIATVAFAATLTMPGGYNNDGMANLAGRTAFKAFVLLNSTAFGLSIRALSFHYDATTMSGRIRVGYIYTAGLCIYMAELAMVLAFLCSTYVVLPRTIGLGIAICVVFGCVMIVDHIRSFLDPNVRFLGSPDSSHKRYLRNLLFDYGMLSVLAGFTPMWRKPNELQAQKGLELI